MAKVDEEPAVDGELVGLGDQAEGVDLGEALAEQVVVVVDVAARRWTRRQLRVPIVSDLLT